MAPLCSLALGEVESGLDTVPGARVTTRGSERGVCVCKSPGDKRARGELRVSPTLGLGAWAQAGGQSGVGGLDGKVLLDVTVVLCGHLLGRKFGFGANRVS